MIVSIMDRRQINFVNYQVMPEAEVLIKKKSPGLLNEYSQIALIKN
jgi:hypothetical protein